MVIIAIGNRKGGVGKTTTTLNIGCFLSTKFDKKVLIIDNDQQKNISELLKPNHNFKINKSIVDIYLSGSHPKDVILESRYDNILLIPAHDDLNNVNNPPKDIDKDYRGKKTHKKISTQVLKKWLILYEDILINEYGIDIVLIDSAPQMGVVNKNGYEASDTMIVVLEPNDLAWAGLESFIDKLIAPKKKNEAVLLFNMADEKNKIYKEMYEELYSSRNPFRDNVLNSVVHMDYNIKYSISGGKPIAMFDLNDFEEQDNNPFIEYKSIINELIERKVIK